MLWALDRGTFRAIVVAATMQKRVQHEAILDKMAVFASLTPENRAAIADCLTPQVRAYTIQSRQGVIAASSDVANHGAAAIYGRHLLHEALNTSGPPQTTGNLK